VSAGDSAGDSAGVDWEGRTLSPLPYADDDGRPDPALATALAQLGAAAEDESEIVRALSGARLFAAVIPDPQSSSDLAVITLTGVDGRRALPVFTSPGTLSGWRPDARPVPVSGPRAAQSAVAEGCDLLELDPAGPVRHVVRRPAVWALAQGRTWVPSYANPLLAQEISVLAARLGLTARCERGAGAELRIVLSLPRGLDAHGVDELVTRMSQSLGRSQLVADEVDSVDLRLRSA
jgi:type III secretion system (T3SS) SseB-like protein